MLGRGIGTGMMTALALVSASVGTAAAQDWRVVSGSGWCNDRDGDGDRARYCEVREMTWPASGTVAVDAKPNGGIEVTASSGGGVRVLARVSASADEEAEARDLVSSVRLRTSGTIAADGPHTSGHSWWSVSYRLTVPAQTDLDLRSHNGGITLNGVRGHTEFATTNGGVRITDSGGSMHGRTTNGGVKVALAGSQWDGEGLDVTTTNGGVVLEVPENFNAHLETGTVNGGVRLDFPVRVQGRIDKEVSTDLGSGGPTIRAVTTNGGVTVRRK
jgi:putative adhesin